MKVLGVDPSTHTGLVVLSSDAEPGLPGPCVLMANEVEVPGEGIPRAAGIAQRVTVAALGMEVDLVVIEGMVLRSPAALVLAEINTLIRHALWKHDIEVAVVPPASLKKFVIGKGAGPGTGKPHMILHSYKRWGFEDASDNVVDAHGLAMVGLALLDSWEPTCTAQREVLAKLTHPGVKSQSS